MKVVTLGEMLMRLSTPRGVRLSETQNLQVHYGGAEANVAAALSQYGVPSVFVSKLPDTSLGKACLQVLNRFEVDTSKAVLGEGRLGTYYLEIGEGIRGSQVLYDRKDSAISLAHANEFDWDAIFDGATWFHWSGITPALSPEAAALTKVAVAKAKEAGLKISVDLNYRAKLWDYGQHPMDIMPELVELVDVVVGNEGHTQLMLGIPKVTEQPFTAPDDYEEALIRVFRNFPNVKHCAFTLRDNLSASHNRLKAILSDGSSMVVSKSYEINHIVDRVGGGDAFMGGLLYGLIKVPNDIQYAVDFGVASSVLKHSISGDFTIATVSEVESLMYQHNYGEVAR